MGALLFVPAGTLHWPAAWVFLAAIAIIGPACGLWLARTDPALLAERMRPTVQADQPAADKKFMLAFGLAALIWFVVIGLDRAPARLPCPARRCRRSGLAMHAAFHRLHHVGDARKFVRRAGGQGADRARPSRRHRSGPYAWVRHPMYSGIMLFFVGVPLLLGSWWGVGSRRCSPFCSPFAPASRNAR